jgi:hypothetical protein
LNFRNDDNSMTKYISLFLKFALMFAYSEDFPNAVKDYESFLAKKYPQKTVLKLVGDRYKLTGTERAMLYRGFTPRDKAEMRRGKLIEESKLKNEILHVDAFNQLLTIGSYLHGRVVFISNDGFLRDASEVHGKAIETLLPFRAVEVVLGYLIKTEISAVHLYFDNQVTGFEIFCEKLEKSLPDFVLQPEIIVSANVDKNLINQTEGIICSSDSAIIERTELKVFDLARATLEYHFWPKFFDLNSIFTF